MFQQVHVWSILNSQPEEVQYPQKNQYPHDPVLFVSVRLRIFNSCLFSSFSTTSSVLLFGSFQHLPQSQVLARFPLVLASSVPAAFSFAPDCSSRTESSGFFLVIINPFIVQLFISNLHHGNPWDFQSTKILKYLIKLKVLT